MAEPIQLKYFGNISHIFKILGIVHLVAKVAERNLATIYHKSSSFSFDVQHMKYVYHTTLYHTFKNSH